MIFSIVLLLFITLIGVAIILSVCLNWCLNELGIDFQDFLKADLAETVALTRNKFLDRFKLMVWEMRRKYSHESPNLPEDTSIESVFQRICNSSNENFYDWSRSNRSVHIRLIDTKEITIDVIKRTQTNINCFAITLNFPDDIEMRVKKLFFAYGYMNFIHVSIPNWLEKIF